MGEQTQIGWTHHTFNGWWGCENVSPECDNCYAEGLSKRWGHAIWGKDAPRRFFGDKHWNEPLKWNRAAEEAGERRRVFCSSMADVFEKRPDLDPQRARLWALIKATPWLDWLLLTKRPQFAARMLPWADGGELWFNVWVGVTCGHQGSVWRVDALRKIPAAVRFVSAEPLLDPILPDLSEIDWLIIGGESGPGHRDMDPQWAVDLEAHARTFGTKVFVKQASGPRPGTQGKLPAELYQIREFPR